MQRRYVERMLRKPGGNVLAKPEDRRLVMQVCRSQTSHCAAHNLDSQKPSMYTLGPLGRNSEVNLKSQAQFHVKRRKQSTWHQAKVTARKKTSYSPHFHDKMNKFISAQPERSRQHKISPHPRSPAQTTQRPSWAKMVNRELQPISPFRDNHLLTE